MNVNIPIIQENGETLGLDDLNKILSISIGDKEAAVTTFIDTRSMSQQSLVVCKWIRNSSNNRTVSFNRPTDSFQTLIKIRV